MCVMLSTEQNQLFSDAKKLAVAFRSGGDLYQSGLELWPKLKTLPTSPDEYVLIPVFIGKSLKDSDDPLVLELGHFLTKLNQPKQTELGIVQTAMNLVFAQARVQTLATKYPDWKGELEQLRSFRARTKAKQPLCLIVSDTIKH
jgi:hypothetical protein